MGVTRMRRTGLLALLLAITFAVGAAGCFNPFSPRVSTERVASTPAPAPNSPQNVIRLFAWCWQNRDPALYSEIFTADYSFVFAANDSAGNAYRDSPWIRDDEMSMSEHMFQGGTNQPPASDIQITIDNLLVPQPDTRPGRNPTYHKSISTSVNLKVTFDRNGTPDVWTINGRALFYVVRGDSAMIPEELKAKGFKADPTRWWIERWEDQTAGNLANLPGPIDLARARHVTITTLAPGEVTFGALKSAFR